MGRGVWVTANGKGLCRIAEDHITSRLFYEEKIREDEILHGWLNDCSAKAGGALCWEAQLSILEEDDEPWYGPAQGPEPEYDGSIKVKLIPGPSLQMETQIKVGEDEGY